MQTFLCLNRRNCKKRWRPFLKWPLCRSQASSILALSRNAKYIPCTTSGPNLVLLQDSEPTNLFYSLTPMTTKDALKIHEKFRDGYFVIKRSSVPFSAVAAGMCLEQTINRSSKTSGGIIGNTKRKEFVARWNIIHHELMSVNHVFPEIAGIPLHNTELTVNFILLTLNKHRNIKSKSGK